MDKLLRKQHQKIGKGSTASLFHFGKLTPLGGLAFSLPMIFDQSAFAVILQCSCIAVAFDHAVIVGPAHEKLNGIPFPVGHQHQVIASVPHRNAGGGLKLFIDFFQQIVA